MVSAGSCNLQTVHFKSPELGTEFGSLNIRHIKKTREKGPHCWEVTNKKKVIRDIACQEPSFFYFVLCGMPGFLTIQAGKHISYI